MNEFHQSNSIAWAVILWFLLRGTFFSLKIFIYYAEFNKVFFGDKKKNVFPFNMNEFLWNHRCWEHNSSRTFLLWVKWQVFTQKLFCLSKKYAPFVHVQKRYTNRNNNASEECELCIRSIEIEVKQRQVMTCTSYQRISKRTRRNCKWNGKVIRPK